MVREMTSKSVPMGVHPSPAGDGCKLTIDGETYIRSGPWLAPIFRVVMLVGVGVAKGLDIQMAMVADTLNVKPGR
jgi:hypothetical protein